MARPSPLQNRCAPDGALRAVRERGTLMGNRGGRLHRDDGALGRARWKSRAWICCLTAFRGRHREMMGPGYTEIFFLDEATALAAGHRPCFECRRADALAFAAAWGRATGTAPPRAGAMDLVLHAERLAPPTSATYSAMPSGAMFTAGGEFFLRTAGGERRWSFTGYGAETRAHNPDEALACVTPHSVRAAIAAGYVPRPHPSAMS